MNRTNIFFGESHSDWLPVRGGESGDFVFRRGDGHAFAKIAPASRRGELAGERDRLIWLKGRGVACPEVINWQEEQGHCCKVSDEAAFCLIQRPYISKTLLTRRISPRG
ncbi:hypothetical protein MZH48_25095, partial [Escherichia coli]|nr:hypothetical protein [Escherichia coli]